jgi:hypothetical protein
MEGPCGICGERVNDLCWSLDFSVGCKRCQVLCARLRDLLPQVTLAGIVKLATNGLEPKEVTVYA